jgi:phage tail-like protein
MIEKIKRTMKYGGFGVLIFALAVGFTFAHCEYASAADPRKADPLVGMIYRLDVNNKVAGYFTEAYDIGSQHEIIEQKIVSQKGVETLRKIPGRLKFPDVVLKRGVSVSMDLANWRRMVEQGNVAGARSQVTIVFMDSTLKEIARWNLANAWPNKLICNPLDVSLKGAPSAQGIEVIAITSEWIERVK